MINFSPWKPDSAAFGTDASVNVDGVVPSASGFRPMPSFFNVTGALTARAQGAYTTRGLQGTTYNFAGDATKLYKQSTDGLTWEDASRTVGGAYSCATDKWWDFAAFGDYVLATDGNDVPQYYQMDVSTDFALLAGSPPTANFVGVIRDFAVLARRNTAFNTLNWSAINNVADWVPSATTLADSQAFPDGGQIMGFVGGEYGIVFLERGIWRMAFEGPPTVFRFDKIANLLGCRAERSIAAYENLIFFLSDDGPYMIRGGSEIIPIGSDTVDEWIEDNLDANYLFRVSSAIDPIRMIYVMGFASGSASSGTPDTIIMYHWPTGTWAKASGAAAVHEILYTGSTQATYTIDGLDALSGTIDGLPYPTDSRFYAGTGRLLLSAFNTSHQQGFWTGVAMAATVETGDVELNEGFKTLLRSIRPMVEGSMVTPSVSIGYRNRLQDPVNYSTAIPANDNGVCPQRVNARYHRARVTIPAGQTWDKLTGLADIVRTKMGKR